MDAPRPTSVVTAVVTVAVASPIAAVTAGLSTMLADHPGIDLVDQHRPLPSTPDVVLYDAHALPAGGADLERLLATTSVVLAVCNELRPSLAGEALARGAHGTIDLGTDRDGLVASVLAAASAARSGTTATVTGLGSPRRLGASVGLTPREVDVLSKITQGLSNQEIAEQSYLSINSVKTYIRSAYRRIGVTSRAQAVVWCVQNGFPSTLAA